MSLGFVDAKGDRHEVNDLEATIYRSAHDSNLTVPQMINRKYANADPKRGTAFEQLCASSGLLLHDEAKFGLRAPTMEQIFNGTAQIGATGVITHEAAPASRILFPAVILELIENKLKVDRQTAPALFDSMVALDTTVAGSRTEQPQIDYTRPESARSKVISQLAEPSAMLSITSSDVTRAIPTLSLGLEISDQAMSASTLDLVTLAVARQAEVERAARVDEYIDGFLNGDADYSQAALPAIYEIKSDQLDALDVTSGSVTHLAWMKWLYRNKNKRVIDWVMCDLVTAIAIENRVGKPHQGSTSKGDDPNSPRIDALQRVANLGIQDVQIFLLEDGVIPTGKVLGIDSRYAIRRIRNSEATYSAVEKFVLRRSSALRFDFGEMAFRMFDEAFDVLDMATT